MTLRFRYIYTAKLLMRVLLLFIGTCFLQLAAFAQQAVEENPIVRAIDKYGNEFTRNRNITSVSIGVYKEGEIYTRHLGSLVKGGNLPPTDETIYEIASVTKTMTGYLVAKAVLEDKIRLDDNIRAWLPFDYPNLQFNGQPVTIKHLLTHTAGLPQFLPLSMNTIFSKLDETVPARYNAVEKSSTKEQFFQDLKTITLNKPPGSSFSYSNAGAELMGYILESVYGKPIEDLFRETIFDPNVMSNTGISLNESRQNQLARGYWMKNDSLSHNQLDPLWGSASGVKMTLPDMMRYIGLQLNTADSIVAESHRVLYTEGKTLKLAYFWRAWTDKYGLSFNHHGGTTGTQNWLFLYPKYKLGISIITNQSGPETPELLNETVKKILKEIARGQESEVRDPK